MFKRNKAHLQNNLFGFRQQLPESMQGKLDTSEEYLFYKLIYCSIREEDFACLYSEKASRPNAPINAMVSALILKERRGWTYEELFKEMAFNLLTKTAFGLADLAEMPFCEASLFNFQNRLNRHFVETGENLLEKVFDHLTQRQLKALQVKTTIQRTDSFLASSNIRNYTRLQLLIELVLRIWRVLSDEDKTRFREQFSGYLGKSSGQYIFRLKADDLPHELEKIGQLYLWIAQNLQPNYADIDIFRAFQRVFEEHFCIVDEKLEVKANDKLHSGCLQSPDDLDATYRSKGDKESRGQSINVVETAHPDNDLNLITDIAVNANNIDDSKVLQERLEPFKEKMPDLEELHFDGGYGSEEVDQKLEELAITGIQTAVRGVAAEVPMTIETIAEDQSAGSPTQYRVQCPLQTVVSQPTRKRHKACFDLAICSTCPVAAKCPATLGARARTLYFTHLDALSKKRQQAIYNIPKERRKLRANIEATVREFTFRMPQGKLKVRGAFKTELFAFGAAIAINFARIYRYLKEHPEKYREIAALIHAFAHDFGCFVKHFMLKSHQTRLLSIHYFFSQIRALFA